MVSHFEVETVEGLDLPADAQHRLPGGHPGPPLYILLGGPLLHEGGRWFGREILIGGR
jgi:hypothetical protein